MIGSFGRTAFVASSDQVRTFRDMQKTNQPRFAEHAVIGKKPVIEFVGPSLNEFTFNIRLDVALGINPRTEIDQLSDIRDAGQAQPLVIGGKFEGNYVIQSMAESRNYFDNRGNILVAVISLTLKEAANV